MSSTTEDEAWRHGSTLISGFVGSRSVGQFASHANLRPGTAFARLCQDDAH